MAEAGTVLHALFQWLHSLRSETARSVDDIASGELVWQVLQEIDSDAFPGELPSPTSQTQSAGDEIAHLNNLKHIYQALTAYIVERCQRRLPLPTGEPDLEAIASSTSEADVTQLLKLVLLAAIFGRFSMDYIQQLTSFSEDVQAQFYLILEEPEAIEEEEQKMSSPEPEANSSQIDGNDMMSGESGQGKDPEIVYEERIADLVAINKGLEHETAELKEQLENMHDLHTKLQKSYDNLDAQQQDTAERLDALRTGKGEQSIVGIQRAKMQQQENVIASLEAQTRNLQEENSKLKVQADLSRTQAEEFQQMQDDMHELKHERDQLQRKANAAEKYKQKLQSLQKVEDENEALQYRVTEMQRQLKESDSEHSDISGLRLENDEFRRLVSNIEQELKDSIDAKKRAEFDNITLSAKLQQADDQATRWHRRAEELQSSLDERADPDTPSTPRATRSDALDFPALDEDKEEKEKEMKDETEINQAASAGPGDSQDVITEQEMQSIISIMKAHARHSANEEKTAAVHEQQKLAAKIEKCRADAQASRQVIDYLAQPRVEFVAAKDLDQGSPYSTVSPTIDDAAFNHGLARRSARSSVTSLSAVSRRSSVASFHLSTSTANFKRRSMFRGVFGAPGGLD